MQVNKGILLSLLMFPLVIGCSLNYEETMLAEDISETVPDTILMDISHTVIKNSMPAFRIIAEKAEAYGKKKETWFNNVLFQEFDDNGVIITEGIADHAVLFTETENTELWGNIIFYSSTEESRISSDYLYWNNESKTLSGKPENSVTINKDSGTEIKGKGFSADLRTKTVLFDSSVKGKWVDESD